MNIFLLSMSITASLLFFNIASFSFPSSEERKNSPLMLCLRMPSVFAKHLHSACFDFFTSSSVQFKTRILTGSFVSSSPSSSSSSFSKTSRTYPSMRFDGGGGGGGLLLNSLFSFWFCCCSIISSFSSSSCSSSLLLLSSASSPRFRFIRFSFLSRNRHIAHTSTPSSSSSMASISGHTITSLS